MKDIELQAFETWFREAVGVSFDGAKQRGAWDLGLIESAYKAGRAAVEADRAQRVPEGCYLSWGGFNIHGDSKSIQEVNRLMHEAGTVPDLKAMLAQSYKELSKEARDKCVRLAEQHSNS